MSNILIGYKINDYVTLFVSGISVVSVSELVCPFWGIAREPSFGLLCNLPTSPRRVGAFAILILALRQTEI